MIHQHTHQQVVRFPNEHLTDESNRKDTSSDNSIGLPNSQATSPEQTDKKFKVCFKFLVSGCSMWELGLFNFIDVIVSPYKTQTYEKRLTK